MDFLQFIPSKTVVDHVRKTGYKLTATDAAYIVYNSDFPLKEKLRAFREIIATMPDCALGNSSLLHTHLSVFVEQQEKVLALFEENGNGFYFFGERELQIFYRDCFHKTWQGIDETFYNLQDCLKAVHDFPREDFPYMRKIEIEKYVTVKNITSWKSFNIMAVYNLDSQLLYIWSLYGLSESAEEKYKNAVHALAYLKLGDDFPCQVSSESRD